MTMFYRTVTGGALRLDMIQSIGNVVTHKNGEKLVDRYQMLHLGGDQAAFRVGTHEVDLILRTPVQIMPAQPGLQLIHIDTTAPEPDLARTPLIAWALCVDGKIHPVTPAGVDDDMTEPSVGWWVEMPDGGFYAVCGVFDIGFAKDEAELLAWARRGYCPGEEDQWRRSMASLSCTTLRRRRAAARRCAARHRAGRACRQTSRCRCELHSLLIRRRASRIWRIAFAPRSDGSVRRLEAFATSLRIYVELLVHLEQLTLNCQ